MKKGGAFSYEMDPGAGAQAPIAANSGGSPTLQISYSATGTHRYPSPSASTDQKQ